MLSSWSLKLLKHLLEEPSHLDEFINFLIAIHAASLLAAFNDVPPVSISPQQGLFAHDNEMPACPRDCNVESPAVLNET